MLPRLSPAAAVYTFLMPLIIFAAFHYLRLMLAIIDARPPCCRLRRCHAKIFAMLVAMAPLFYFAACRGDA
jgi:hypothetical protein